MRSRKCSGLDPQRARLKVLMSELQAWAADFCLLCWDQLLARGQWDFIIPSVHNQTAAEMFSAGFEPGTYGS